MDSLFWVALLGIVWIDLLLSGDNAVVIALGQPAASRETAKVGHHRRYRGGHRLACRHVVLRRLALDVPALSIVGGVYLLWVAAQLLIGEDEKSGPSWRCMGRLGRQSLPSLSPTQA